MYFTVASADSNCFSDLEEFPTTLIDDLKDVIDTEVVLLYSRLHNSVSSILQNMFNCHWDCYS